MASLAGETVVFTGALVMKRAEAQQKAKDAGAKVTGSISKNTTLVVAGADAGSKLDTAKGLGVKIITEDEFNGMLSGGAKKAAAKKAPAPKVAKAAPKKTPANTAGGSGNNLLSGKTIVFTGTMDTKRGTATAMATTAGAKVTGSVSGNTDIVVAGAAAGSKLDAAKAKGIQIITEAEFLAACDGGSGSTDGSPASSRKMAKKNANEAAVADDEDYELTFIDTCGDGGDDEETIEFSADASYSTVKHDASEVFGYESGAAIHLAASPDGLPLKIDSSFCAKKLIKKYGTTFYVIPKDDDDDDEEEEEE